jgi:hypothetical protein
MFLYDNIVIRIFLKLESSFFVLALQVPLKIGNEICSVREYQHCWEYDTGLSSTGFYTEKQNI